MTHVAPLVTGPIHIQLLHVRDCPNVERVRALLQDSLEMTGLEVPIEDVEGEYPSPTLLINGRDVTGATQGPDACCRLDLPTQEQIVAALFQSPEEEQMSNPKNATTSVGQAIVCLACRPTPLASDTRAKRIADRLLPTGWGQWIFFGVVAVALGIHGLPGRAGLALIAIATTAASAWCLVNFWRCREAHCVVTGFGWAMLAAFDFVEVALGRSIIHGDEVPSFLVVLLVGCSFECLWTMRHGSNALTTSNDSLQT